MKSGPKLYEKFSSDTNRKTQAIEWKKIADELEQEEQINVESVAKLKQNVTNWVRRATVSIFASQSIELSLGVFKFDILFSGCK